MKGRTVQVFLRTPLFEARYGLPETVALNRASREYLEGHEGGVLSPRGLMLVGGPGELEEFERERETLGLTRLTAAEARGMVPILDPERAPRVHSPPLNHVGLWVDNLPAAVEWLGERGMRFAAGGIRKGASGYDICFVHPKANEDNPIGGEGVLIELVQAPPDVIEELA